MHLRCYSCGFAPEKAETFFSPPTDGVKRMFCPQCCRANPTLAEAELSPAILPLPDWKMQATNEGLYVMADRSANPIHPEHQLLNAPASLLKPGLLGTLREHHHFLAKRGRERSAQFQARCEEIRQERETMRLPGESDMGLIDRTSAWYHSVTDDAREACGVGDHGRGLWIDGRTMELRWRIVQRLL